MTGYFTDPGAASDQCRCLALHFPVRESRTFLLTLRNERSVPRESAAPLFWSTRPVIGSLLDQMQILTGASAAVTEVVAVLFDRGVSVRVEG